MRAQFALPLRIMVPSKRINCTSSVLLGRLPYGRRSAKPGHSPCRLESGRSRLGLR